MKARTSGSGRTGCEAVQHSDQMHCARCGIQYDVNDQDPPECAPVREVHVRKGCTPGPTTLLTVDTYAKQRGRAVLESLRRDLQKFKP